jgi:hypothetical protein
VSGAERETSLTESENRRAVDRSIHAFGSTVTLQFRDQLRPASAGFFLGFLMQRRTSLYGRLPLVRCFQLVCIERLLMGEQLNETRHRLFGRI